MRVAESIAARAAEYRATPDAAQHEAAPSHEPGYAPPAEAREAAPV